MDRSKNAVNLINGTKADLIFEAATFCPMCHANIVGYCITAVVFSNGKNKSRCSAATLNFCTGCHRVFLNIYNCNLFQKDYNRDTYKTTDLISSTPFLFEKREFDKKLTQLSPNFDLIYNQACKAEIDHLDQIAGIGYRKSIEFLVKDFAIHLRPRNADKIKNMTLGNCIKEYIDDPRIKILAEKSVWIGNDETHYVRKHENKDISDMKNFIDALVYFISMILITEEAEAMQKS